MKILIDNLIILKYFNFLEQRPHLAQTTWSFSFPTYQRIYSEMAREDKRVVFLF